jgi:hypothetical protein
LTWSEKNSTSYQLKWQGREKRKDTESCKIKIPVYIQR